MNNFINFLNETANQDFIDELQALSQKSQEIQDQFPVEYESDDTYDPEANEPRRSWQTIPKNKFIQFKKQAEKFKSDLVSPDTRRVSYLQTKDEEDIEKNLLRLFQKYADQNFFKNELYIYHDFDYFAAILGGELETKRDDTNYSYLSKENSRLPNVLSCHATPKKGDTHFEGYGMILQGHVVFASRSDLASQTIRRASQEVKDFYKHSGLPKRTGTYKIQKKISNPLINLYKNLLIKKNIEPTQDMINNYTNHVVLNKKDFEFSNNIEELLLANANIIGWYFTDYDNKKAYPQQFWKKAKENNIQKPIYHYDQFKRTLNQVALADI